MRKEKLYEFDEKQIIPLFVTTLILCLAIGIPLYFWNHIAGYVIMAAPIFSFSVAYIYSVLFGNYVCLDEEFVRYRWSTIFNCEICKEKWSDLQYIEKRNLYHTEEEKATNICYSAFCLYFRGCRMEAYMIRWICKIKKENGVIIIFNTKRNRRILREYLPEQFKYVLD
ncbi:MAG: hypothetical protein IKC48_01925 [Clostridia bacterium]|nr:hypothetical protein [Clostridia bacterium]